MRLFQPLRTRAILLLWGGQSLSAIGDQLYAVALSWIAVGVFGSRAGYLTALQALVLLIAALGVGRWADRWSALRSLIGADLLRAAVLLAVVAVWAATGGPGAVPLIAAVIVLAAGQAVFQPAVQTVLPALVEPRLLPATNGLMDTTDRSARLLGPGLIALLAGVVPVMHFLTIDAGSFLISASAVMLIHRGRRNVSRPKRIQESTWRSIKRGASAMAAHPLLGFVLRSTALVNGAFYAAFYLALPLTIERLGIQGPGGSGLGAYGVVIAAYGCTNLASTLVLGGRAMPARPQFQMFTGSILVGLGTMGMGLAVLLPPEWRLPGMAAMAAFGAAGGPMKDIPVAVLRQTRLPPSDMASGMRVYIAANSAGALVAMLLTPTLLGVYGTVPVIVASGALMFGTAATGLIRHAGWAERTSA